MVLFNNIPYKRMHLTSKVNLTKRFSKKYKRMRLITRLYGIAGNIRTKNFHTSVSKSVSVVLFSKSVYFKVYLEVYYRD